MKKYNFGRYFIISALIVSTLLPVSVFAASSAGVKPGSFWYGFDTAFEKINLFFTFNSENKAQKALEYADERLAEIEESAGDNKSADVATAMENYKENVDLATTEAKDIKDETKTESLLSEIASSTSRHQEILAGVLEKVPTEAKEAIQKAIEVSKKEQEEISKQISELKKENTELKNKIEELKGELEKKEEEKKAEKQEVKENKIEIKSEIKDNTDGEEIEKLKIKLGELQKEINKPKVQETKKEETKVENSTKTVTMANGAVVEIGEDGSIVRTIKEAPQKIYTAPTPVPQSQNQTIPPVISPVQTTQPAPTPSLSCMADEWGCSDWSVCSSLGSQDRICNKIFECPSINTQSPLISRSCTPPVIIPTPVAKTYEQLHCPKVYKITDSMGHHVEFTDDFPSTVRKLFGSFVQGSVSQITFKVFVEDPQGLPIHYVWGGNASHGFSRPLLAPPFQIESQINWTLSSEFTIDVSGTVPTGGGSFFSMQYDNGDSYYCYGPGSTFDGVVNFEYTVYPSL